MTHIVFLSSRICLLVARLFENGIYKWNAAHPKKTAINSEQERMAEKDRMREKERAREK